MSEKYAHDIGASSGPFSGSISAPARYSCASHGSSSVTSVSAGSSVSSGSGSVGASDVAGACSAVVGPGSGAASSRSPSHTPRAPATSPNAPTPASTGTSHGRRPRPGGVAYGEKPYGSDGGAVAVGTTVASSGAP